MLAPAGQQVAAIAWNRTATAIGSAAGIALSVSGEIASISSNLPQRELYRLIRWAEERGVELGELTVKRPTLEEVFLQVTKDGSS